MNSAYYAPLVLLPAIVTEPGSYLTRCGETVTVTAVSIRHDHGCKGTYSNGVSEGWHKSGRIFAGQETANDIVKAV
jgi:hypothetical protein